MKLTNQDVIYTAGLAKLTFDETQQPGLAKDLSDILDYAAKINGLDTQSVKPLTHVLENENVFREDSVKPGLTIEEALSNAPDADGRTIKVPKML